jgi:hypothetical protein
MLSSSEIKKQIQQYLAQSIDLDQLEDWLVSASWNMHQHAPADAQEMASALELRFAEYSCGHLSESDLRHELSMIYLHGCKLPSANMVVFRLIPEPSSTGLSSTFETEPAPDSFIVGTRFTIGCETRSASGRNITARENLAQQTA